MLYEWEVGLRVKQCSRDQIIGIVGYEESGDVLNWWRGLAWPGFQNLATSMVDIWQVEAMS